MIERTFPDTLPAEPFFVLDRELNLVYANREYLNLVGLAPVRHPRPFGLGLPTSDAVKLRQIMNNVLASNEATTFEDFWLERGLWLEYRVRPCERGLTVLVINRTEDKVAGFIEKNEEGRWRDAAESAAMGMGQLSLDGYWLHANQRGLEILGYEAGELTDVSLTAMCAEGQNEQDKLELTELLTGARSVLSSERSILRPDGERAWVRFSFSLTRPSRNQPPQFAVVFDNIDERKSQELSLKFALQSAQMGGWDYDATLDQTLRSERFDEIFGVTAALTEWKFATFLERLHPDDRTEFVDLFRRSLETGEDFSAQVRIQHFDGQVRWITLSGRVYLNRQGRAVRMAGLVQDVTAHKQAELELQTAKLAAEDANREKSYFLANMSHEIRTPLGAILGFTDILRESTITNGERDHYLDILTRNGRNLARLIDDILDLSKVESGHLDVERVPVAIHTLVDEVVSLLRTKAELKGIAFDVRAKGAIPAQVEADPIRLRQILINVVGNAIKFTRSGGVTLEMEMSAGDPATLIFRVTDSGPGIRADAVDKLFAPFSQADSSTTRMYGGTGLGLALSRRLARALGGDLVLEHTAVDLGSTFTLTLPAIHATAPETIEVRPTPAAKPVIPTNPRPGTRVLVADDSPDNQELIRFMLDRRGISTKLADDGQQAVDLALEDDFDVILMDMQMPRLDGYEATRRLRQAGFRAPIVALTANAMRTDREKCLRAGCSEYVSKPINATDLYRVMDQVLEHARH